MPLLAIRHIPLRWVYAMLLTFNCLLLCGPARAALGDAGYVSEQAKRGALTLADKAGTATLVAHPDDHTGVLRALQDLQKDIERVTGKLPQRAERTENLQGHVVIVGTLGKSPLIDRLVEQNKIDPSGIRDRWDGYHLEVVDQPLPGVERALIIAGADKRGTIYGIYDVSEQIGVSPWYYWADVPVEHKSSLYIAKGTRVQDAPVVKYRGIFLNDEAPALTNWVAENHGNYTHEFYVKVFELLLRLKANFLWPAMWNNAFADDDPQNMILADEYGIVMSTSHHEPMMRADKEWNRHGKGPWEYSTNPDNLYQFWEAGARRNKDYESVFTLGMRGQEDEPMSEGENIELLEKIVNDQRKIIEDVFGAPNVTEVPQVWCLYKEVQAYYEKGMRVPDDVILLWTDDNWGNIRRLPLPEERDRTGGAGVYYHFDYVGGPRSYRWINTYPLTKVWEQMNLAHRYQANQIWIVNVGDLKPMEFPTEFFLRMAWDPERWGRENIQEFGQLWAAREFGPQYADEIEALLSGYTRHNGRRKPELMEPDTYSLLYYDEAERISNELTDLVARAEALAQKIPPAKRDAYFQLVLHPVKASAIVTQMNIAIGKNRLYASQGRANANSFAEQARALFAADAALTHQYHTLNGGKWNHLMSQPHIGYTNWNNPEGNQMPVTYHYSPGDYAEMGIAVEGIEAGWPAAVPGEWPHRGKFEMRFDRNGQPQRWLEIFNRGTQPFDFTIKPKADWIKLSRNKGTVAVSEKILVSIDWRKVPEGSVSSALEIRGTGWQGAHIDIHALKPPARQQRHAKGFLEADGYISMEAASFSKNQAAGDHQWRVIPQHGRTHSSLTRLPVSDRRFESPADAPYVEYDVTFFSEGEVRVNAAFAPTWPVVHPDGQLRYAIAVGDEKPQVVDILAATEGTDSQWEEAVKNGVRVSTSTHRVSPGRSKIRLYAMDPALTVQKIVVDTGGLLPSYLGPPESPRK